MGDTHVTGHGMVANGRYRWSKVVSKVLTGTVVSNGYDRNKRNERNEVERESEVVIKIDIRGEGYKGKLCFELF